MVWIRLPKFLELLKEQRPDLFNSSTDRSSSPHVPTVVAGQTSQSDLLTAPNGGRIQRNSSYFKSLLILAAKDKMGSSHKSERGTLEKGCIYQKEPEGSSRYVKYNRDRTICWRQSKQPFFGIEKIPVTPVSPLQKYHRWDDLVAGHSEIAAPSNVKLTIKPFTRQVLPQKHRLPPQPASSMPPRGPISKIITDPSD